MRIGISVAQCSRLARPDAVVAAVRAAEHLGYSSVWVCDSLLDPARVLSAAAGATSHVRLGASLVLAPDQDASALARSLAAVDLVSRGRLSVALGVPPGSPEDGTEAILDVLDTCWPGTSGPSRLLAGMTDGTLARVARRADGWSPLGVPVEFLAPMWATVRELARSYGRDLDDLRLVVRAGTLLTPAPIGGARASYQGDAEQVARDVEATWRMGADEVVLRLHGDLSLDDALDGYARIAEAAELREAQRA